MKITKRQLRRIIKEAIGTPPWSGGSNEVMLISSGDVAWGESGNQGLSDPSSRRGEVEAESIPAAVTIKDTNDEYTLTKGTVASQNWQQFNGVDKDGIKVRVTVRLD